MRTCETCGQELVRRDKESRHDYLNRRYCSHDCVREYRRREAAAKWVDRLERIHTMLDAGHTPTAILAALGLRRSSLADWLYQHGHTDLARQFRERERAMTTVTMLRKIDDDLDLPKLPGAACKYVDDPEIFHIQDWHSDYTAKQRETARQICGRCPLDTLNACLEYAIATRQEGWWANTTEGERKKMRRDRERAA